MSQASIYAVSCAAKNTELDTVHSTRPADYKAQGLTVSVTDTGGAAIDRGVILPPADALALGQWLVNNFAAVPMVIT